MNFDRVSEPYPHRIEMDWRGLAHREFELLSTPFQPPAFLHPIDLPIDCIWCCTYFPWRYMNEEWAKNWLWTDFLWRVLPYEHDGYKHWLLLRRNCGLAYREGESNGARFKRWKQGAMNPWIWLRSPQEYIRQWFENEVARPDADVHIAFKWLQTPETEKTWATYRWKEGQGSAYAALVRDIMTVFYAYVRSTSPTPKSSSTPLRCRFTGWGKLTGLHWYWWRDGYIELTPPLRRLNALCHAAFEPYYGWNRLWRGVNEMGLNIAPPTPYFEVAPPTEHEKLEAFLRLQKWLASLGEWENIGPQLPR